MHDYKKNDFVFGKVENIILRDYIINYILSLVLYSVNNIILFLTLNINSINSAVFKQFNRS